MRRKCIFNKLTIQILKTTDIQRKERRFHTGHQRRFREQVGFVHHLEEWMRFINVGRKN